MRFPVVCCTVSSRGMPITINVGWWRPSNKSKSMARELEYGIAQGIVQRETNTFCPLTKALIALHINLWFVIRKFLAGTHSKQPAGGRVTDSFTRPSWLSFTPFFAPPPLYPHLLPYIGNPFRGPGYETVINIMCYNHSPWSLSSYLAVAFSLPLPLWVREFKFNV